jgi:hypothetical protein
MFTLILVYTLSVEHIAIGKRGKESSFANPFQAEDIGMIPIAQKPRTKIFVKVCAGRSVNHDGSC